MLSSAAVSTWGMSSWAPSGSVRCSRAQLGAALCAGQCRVAHVHMHACTLPLPPLVAGVPLPADPCLRAGRELHAGWAMPAAVRGHRPGGGYAGHNAARRGGARLPGGAAVCWRCR